VKNFTPLPDCIVKRYGVTVAAVYGRMWRYSRQSKNGLCSAAQGKIADKLGLTRPTVSTHIQTLVKAGCIEIDTVRKNNSNIYKVLDVKEFDTEMFGCKEILHPGVKKLDSEQPPGVKKFYTKKGIKKDNKKEPTADDLNGKDKNPFMIYQEDFGPLSSTSSDQIICLEDDYTEAWVMEAMEIAVKNNKRNLAYVEGILKRWQANGKDAGKSANGRTKIDTSKGLSGR